MVNPDFPYRAVGASSLALSLLVLTSCKLGALSQNKTIAMQGGGLGLVSIPVAMPGGQTGVCVYETKNLDIQSVAELMKGNTEGAFPVTQTKISQPVFQAAVNSGDLGQYAEGLQNDVLTATAGAILAGSIVGLNYVRVGAAEVAQGLFSAFGEKPPPPNQALAPVASTMSVRISDDGLTIANEMIQQLHLGLARQVEIDNAFTLSNDLLARELIEVVNGSSGSKRLSAQAQDVLIAALRDPDHGYDVARVLRFMGQRGLNKNAPADGVTMMKAIETFVSDVKDFPNGSGDAVLDLLRKNGQFSNISEALAFTTRGPQSFQMYQPGLVREFSELTEKLVVGRKSQAQLLFQIRDNVRIAQRIGEVIETTRQNPNSVSKVDWENFATKHRPNFLNSWRKSQILLEGTDFESLLPSQKGLRLGRPAAYAQLKKQILAQAALLKEGGGASLLGGEGRRLQGLARNTLGGATEELISSAAVKTDDISAALVRQRDEIQRVAGASRGLVKVGDDAGKVLMAPLEMCLKAGGGLAAKTMRLMVCGTIAGSVALAGKYGMQAVVNQEHQAMTAQTLAPNSQLYRSVSPAVYSQIKTQLSMLVDVDSAESCPGAAAPTALPSSPGGAPVQEPANPPALPAPADTGSVPPAVPVEEQPPVDPGVVNEFAPR